MDFPCRFGRYELLRPLAKGGMAELFLARSFGVEGFEKQLVIKRILPDLADSQRFVKLFIKEARISASLVHPNIVQVYELGRVASDHFISMEYIHGRDLIRINKALCPFERIPIPFAVYIIANMLRGLAYAHGRSNGQGDALHVIHRDVSPHNVMIGFKGEVKLFDFGIARLVGDSEPSPGMPGAGKYGYMSPEQASGRPMDRRTDIYSAGIVLWEILVGHRLFQDSDRAEKLRKVQEGNIPDPRIENPDIPDELWGVLQAMLAFDPDDRPDRAELAEEELLAVLFRQGWRADAHSLSKYMHERFPDEAGADLHNGELQNFDLASLASDLRRLEQADESIERDTNSRDRTPIGAVKLPRPLRGISGERKKIVVMVGEVLGFTELSARRDATVVVRRHYQLIRRIRGVVDLHGGLLERYQDDRFVVFFGVPKSGEHDLERGLACAIGLLDTVSHAGVAGLRVDLSIGVHRGEITVGSRSGRSIRYLARGDTMKRAHRLCGEADIGEVLVSDKVAAMAGARFRFVGGPSFRMKGNSTAHRSFSLQGVREMQIMTRGRWVARNDEISLVRQAIARAIAGEGGIVSVVGRAGVGKSRFLREVRKMAGVAGLPLISANARVFRGDRPFDVLRAVVAHLIDVDRESNAQAVAEKIRDLMRYGVTQRDVQVIGAMFGLDLETLFPPNIGAMRGAAARLLGGLASHGPVLIVIDDTQHIGTLEREIIGVAIQATIALPLLFVFAGRGVLPAEFRPSHTQVHLSPLDPGATVEVVAELLGVREVGPDLVHLVEKTGEGNPLYLDEITRSLQKDGRITIKDRRAELSTPLDGLQLPHSIEALIAARVDALGPAGKGVLQVGAAIGMSFPPALVQEACGLEAFEALLDDLVERGILLWDSANEYERCTFSSVLVWEVVHRSIIGVRLREYHRMVAEAMERIHGDELDGHRMQLAGHCAGGGRLMDAARLALAAGDRLQDRQLLALALQCWEQGVGWLDRMRSRSHASHICETRLRLRTGRGWRLLGEFQKAEINLQVAQDLAVDSSNLELEARATLMLGRLYRAMGRPMLAKANLESARSSAMDGVSSPSVEELVLWRREVGVDALADLGTIALDAGSTEHAREMLGAARVLAGDEDKLAAKALVALASCHIRAEEYQEGIALLVSARERTQEAGDRIMLGSIENNIGIAHHSAGRYQAALKHFRSALAIRQGIGYRMGAVINLHNIGDAHFRLDDPSRAWAAFRQSRDLAKGIDWGPGELMNEPFLAYLESTHDLKGACQRLDRVAQQADAQGEHETRGAARWLLGRLRWDRGDVDGAEAVWAEGLKLAETMDSPQLARDIRASMDAAQEE